MSLTDVMNVIWAENATRGEEEALSVLLIVDAQRPGRCLGPDMQEGRLEAVAQVWTMTAMQGETLIADIRQAFEIVHHESKTPEEIIFIKNSVIHLRVCSNPNIKNGLRGKRASALSANA